MFAFLKKVIKNRRILYPAIKVRLSHSLIRKKTLYFFCEKKLPLTIYSSEIFNVSGYLFVPNNTVMQIELMVGVEKFPLRYGSERKDVYYAFLNSYASNSGFSGYITGLPQGNHQSNFLITLIDGKSHIIPCGTINVVEAQDLTIITPPPSQIYIGDTVKITGKWIGTDKPISIDIHYDHERQKECVFSFETQMFHAELEFLDFRPPYAPIYLSCVTSGRKFTHCIALEQRIYLANPVLCRNQGGMHISKDKICRIMVINLNCETLGGGEKHMAFFCQFLELYYPFAEIDIITCASNGTHISIEDIKIRFDVLLTRTKLKKVSSLSPKDIAALSSTYDMFVNFTYNLTCYSFAQCNIWMCMFPPKNDESKNDITAHSLLQSNAMIIANSAYSAKFFEERWGNLQNVSVIYPPVLTMAQKPCIPQKEKIIVAVGRFFVGGHSKKQDELVCFFRRHIDLFEGYEFHLIGGLSPSNKEASKYVNKIRKLAAGFPVYLHINASHEEVLSFYKRAQIFWHATGYKEDFLRNPDRMEHFGITTVEAMHYGAIPIVINAGGQPEIVGHGKNGFLWNTEEECIHYTHEIITNKALAQSIAYNAFERSNWFSIEKFHERNTILFNAYHEGNTHD